MARAPAPNQVRIIGGQYRRRLLHFPAVPGLRPSPDRVRETLFNWLGQDLTGKHCLDLFAGSGALGFEAASRHAARVLLVESDPKVVAALQESRAVLGAETVRVERGDALAWLKRSAEQWDIVFLDPPFDSGLAEPALVLLAGRLAPAGVVYLEAPRAFPGGQGFRVLRHDRAGHVHYHLLAPEAPGEVSMAS